MAVGVFDRHQARLAGVLELVVRAFDPGERPSIGDQPLDDVSTVHGGYYTHQRVKINTITTRPDAILVPDRPP